MPTYSDVIQKTRRRLMSGVREQTVQLTQGYTAEGEVLYVGGPTGLSTAPNFLGSIQPGALLGIDLEMFYVIGFSGSTVTVVPGYQGSTPANHVQGSLVYINPRFSLFDIGVAINDDLLDLSAPYNGLGQIQSQFVTYNPTFVGYDLGPNFDTMSSRILEISYKIAPPVRTYPLIRRGMFRTVRGNPDASVFPSGSGVILYNHAYPGLPVQIQFLSPFAPLVNLTDDLTTVAGIPPTMYDLPDLGAFIRLVQPREVKRNFYESQPDPRKAPEIPPQAVANSSVKVEMQRQKRIDAEKDRIEQAYPEAE